MTLAELAFLQDQAVAAGYTPEQVAALAHWAAEWRARQALDRKLYRAVKGAVLGETHTRLADRGAAPIGQSANQTRLDDRGEAPIGQRTNAASQASQRVTPVTPVTVRDASSAGAARTRRWRERQRLRAIAGGADGSVRVTAGVTPVTPVTFVTPVTPGADGAPLKGALRPAPRAGRSRQRAGPKPDRRQRELTLLRPLDGGAAAGVQLYRPNWRHEADPVFREVEAILGRSMPRDRHGGWEFKADLLRQAEAVIAERHGQRLDDRGAAPIGQSEGRATGPPKLAGTG